MASDTGLPAASLVLIGGVESMSRAPGVLLKPEKPCAEVCRRFGGWSAIHPPVSRVRSRIRAATSSCLASRPWHGSMTSASVSASCDLHVSPFHVEKARAASGISVAMGMHPVASWADAVRRAQG